MTKKKPRKVYPNTKNVACTPGLADFVLNLNRILKDHFDEATAIDEAYERIYGAAIGYLLDANSPQRDSAQSQRQDYENLIGSLREVIIRLDPRHIPLPIIEEARDIYAAKASSTIPIDYYIHNTLNQLDVLYQTFQEVDAYRTYKTNPGKPERDALIEVISKTFDDVSSKDCSYTDMKDSDLRLLRKSFVGEICKLIEPAMKLPRLR